MDRQIAQPYYKSADAAGEALRKDAFMPSADRSMNSGCTRSGLTDHSCLPALELTDNAAAAAASPISSTLKNAAKELNDRKGEIATDIAIGAAVGLAMRTPVGQAALGLAGAAALAYAGYGYYTGKFTLSGTMQGIKDGFHAVENGVQNAARDLGTVLHPSGHSAQEIIAAEENTGRNMADVVAFGLSSVTFVPGFGSMIRKAVRRL